ncbi:MAG: hypothetical protein ABR915_16315 [Thermoguttaceae bacterium]|jgi:hypothetical protein
MIISALIIRIFWPPICPADDAEPMPHSAQPLALAMVMIDVAALTTTHPVGETKNEVSTLTEKSQSDACNDYRSRFRWPAIVFAFDSVLELRT